MRNLEPGEIYDQVLAIDKESLYYNHPYQTLFFMGMGEPLMNYNNMMKAINDYFIRRFRNVSKENYGFHIRSAK
jgi:adenine C2-methylase RlmN of 23S rRNA A2503 and tRNA A37